MSGSKITINQINSGTDGAMFGHVWIVVTDANGVQHSYGFIPGDQLPILGVPSPWGVGEISTSDNVDHLTPDYTKEYLITESQAKKIIEFSENVKANPGPYNLEGQNNCTTFVAKSLIQAKVVPSGGMIPGIPAMIPNWLKAKDIQAGILDPSIKKIGDAFKNAKGTISPIILDLNSDGVKTAALSNGVNFDHDRNGFAEQSGWVAPEDGLLVRDLDGNGVIDSGRELFGNQTQLANGSQASNGFAALAELDSNHDGKVDASDAGFATLKVWRDLNGDGYTEAGELLKGISKN